MGVPSWDGRSWTPEISASRIIAVLVFGYLNLLVSMKLDSKVKKKQDLVRIAHCIKRLLHHPILSISDSNIQRSCRISAYLIHLRRIITFSEAEGASTSGFSGICFKALYLLTLLYHNVKHAGGFV